MALTTAVFPVQGVNTDKSFSDAFGALLANKYSKVSGAATISPSKTAKAIPPDSNLSTAARALNADEYLEISAVGLYLSRHEREVTTTTDSSANGQKIMIVLKNDDSHETSDQEKLDNSKTIVTVVRRDASGKQIYKAEMTLLTYGDIEESTERLALSLYQKVDVDKTRSMNNVTRREGMGHNQLFMQKIKGVKMGMFYTSAPVAYADLVTIAFNYKAEAENFFLEFGAGGKLSAGSSSNQQSYGGNFFEMGASYYVVNKIIGVYVGGGVLPLFDWEHAFQIEVAPYLQVGFMFPRNSTVRFYGEFRVAQNVLPFTADNSYDYTYTTQPSKKYYPTEIGLDIGIGW